jgi:predicted transcriptional regulator
MTATSLVLSPEAEAFLQELATKRGMSIGEIVRRALSLDHYLHEQKEQGTKILLQRPDKSLHEVIL